MDYLDRARNRKEAAEILGISPRTIADHRWRKRIGLRAVRVGGSLRFLETDLMKLLHSRRETVASLNPESDGPKRA
jgi:excisionase family DNA binding protein